MRPKQRGQWDVVGGVAPTHLWEKSHQDPKTGGQKSERPKSGVFGFLKKMPSPVNPQIRFAKKITRRISSRFAGRIFFVGPHKTMHKLGLLVGQFSVHFVGGVIGERGETRRKGGRSASPLNSTKPRFRIRKRAQEEGTARSCDQKRPRWPRGRWLALQLLDGSRLGGARE